MRSWKQKFALTVLTLLTALAPVAVAHAAQSSSPSYQVNEVQFGSGGELNACSPTFCAKQSAGELGVGNTASPGYQAQAGFNTDRAPSLEFIVNNTSTDLGVLTSGTTKTTTATFSVKTYLAGGYVVVNASDPPRNGSYTMAGLTTPTASNSAVEQFGINLVANTSPATFGAAAVQVPDSSFSFGTAAAGYNTPNVYKYVKGDTIAQSLKSSGETDFTISYLFNISPVTPSGVYVMNHVLVATSTF